MSVIGITEAYKADSFGEKINLGAGAYRRCKALSHRAPDSQDVQETIMASHTSSHQYGRQTRRSQTRILIKNTRLSLAYHVLHKLPPHLRTVRTLPQSKKVASP